MTRRVNDAALALIRQWEGLRLTAYQDVAGVWTIGYGSTRDVRPGMRISETGAEMRANLDTLMRASSQNLPGAPGVRAR